ncbi:unnamed protein product [Dicrocoelium dendriticum]|nr:unnamed protein product [Dicrocoelium dendriticum]
MTDSLVDSTALLSICNDKTNVSDQRHEDHMLLGDTFDAQLPPTLNLPSLQPPTIIIHPIHNSSSLVDTCDIWSANLPAAASPLLKGSLESLRCVTSGDAKVVYDSRFTIVNYGHM